MKRVGIGGLSSHFRKQWSRADKLYNQRERCPSYEWRYRGSIRAPFDDCGFVPRIPIVETKRASPSVFSSSLLFPTQKKGNMNGFILVRGEDHEGYEIVKMFETEKEALDYAEKYPLRLSCDFYDVIEIVNGDRIDNDIDNDIIT